MDNRGGKKIVGVVLAVIFLVLAIVTFAVSSIRLYQFKLSLPSTWTSENEGRFIAYGLEQWAFLFTIPIVISLLLIAYLIYPSKSEKFSKTAKTLSLILALVGFGVTIFLTDSAILNNPPFLQNILYGLITLLWTSPFWIMGILSIVVFKKDKFENIEKKSYKVGVVILILITLIWVVEALAVDIIGRIIY
ncbi:MAG: hypothetical protein K6343_06130 [Caldisericaceae bacterium]